MIRLHEGDNRDVLRRMKARGEFVHSCVTDPPYGLVSIQKRFGKEGAKAARTEGNDGSFARLSGGFMGAAWDATGIERDPEFWKLVYDVLLPGGYVFAFSGSRTGHWQAVAMETAGFIMHPMHGWVFGSGFPKAHNAEKAVEKVATEQAAEWEGWAYGTQTQKPALEPIYLGQKPFSEKTGAANLLKHGVGAVNIDGCRVPAEGRPLRVGDYKQTVNNTYAGRIDGSLAGGSKAVGSTDSGRHPSNLILDGSLEVVAMFPTTAGAKAPVKGTEPTANGFSGPVSFSGMINRVAGAFHGDAGSAARFFHQFGPDADPLFYHPKAGKADRAGSRHPTVKPIALLQYLIRHITPPGGTVLDPFAGSGTTGAAALREGVDAVLIEMESDYADDIRRRLDLTECRNIFLENLLFYEAGD